MTRELVLYADESVAAGRHFSNFYGGCVVESKQLRGVTERLNAKKAELNFHGEVKWQKVTANYLGKYEALVDAFFAEVAASKVKVRVMFTQNRHVPLGLTPRHHDERYFILYYQFIKHAFGLPHAGLPGLTTRVRLQFDTIPDTFERRAQFRAFLAGLSLSAPFRDARVVIDRQQIAEVDSRDHVLLQCTDIVLGAMQLRLNDMHKEKSPGKTRRGKRTIAKEALYRAVLGRIRAMRPHFNIGTSTGSDGDVANRWHPPYRHWLFVPREHETDASNVRR